MDAKQSFDSNDTNRDAPSTQFAPMQLTVVGVESRRTEVQRRGTSQLWRARLKFENGNSVPAEAEIETDICVVGTGAAGLTLARELNGSGLNVLLLEAGGIRDDPRLTANTFGLQVAGEPFRNPNPSRGRLFGGSTNLWFGRVAVPNAIDFRERDWVPNSGWPLEYRELTPWFQIAARILDVRNLGKLQIRNWPRNATIQTFVQPGRSNLGVFLWARQIFTGLQAEPQLQQSLNVRVLLNATATEVVPDEMASRVKSLHVRTNQGNQFTIRARAYVLAAGGIENPRLLLASNSVTPEGLGNAHDNVGRYFMDHPRGEGLARLDLSPLRRQQLARLRFLGERSRSRFGQVQFRLVFDELTQRRNELLNHSLHAHIVSRLHDSEGYSSLVALARSRHLTGLPSNLAAVVRTSPSLARSLNQHVAHGLRPTKLVVIDQMEQEPDPSSRLQVDHTDRDQFGLPKAVVNWRIGDSTYNSQRQMHILFRDILREFKLGELQSDILDRPGDRPELWDMKHPSGATRMSENPKFGVVDRNCKVHEMRNLYIAGSSVFPVVGHANPTFLIVALAARLADHLKSVYGTDRPTT